MTLVFNVLTEDCAVTETTFINSECTPSKKEVCQSVETRKVKREGFKQNFLSKDDKEVTIKMEHFETVECIIKKWKLTKQV